MSVERVDFNTKYREFLGAFDRYFLEGHGFNEAAFLSKANDLVELRRYAKEDLGIRNHKDELAVNTAIERVGKKSAPGVVRSFFQKDKRAFIDYLDGSFNIGIDKNKLPSLESKLKELVAAAYRTADASAGRSS